MSGVLSLAKILSQSPMLRRQKLLLVDLSSTFDSSQFIHIEGIEDDPAKMWKKLEDIHVHKQAGSHFNAYDHLFGIRKEESESLSTLTARVAQAMQQCKNLCPPDFKLETLDNELELMALIRALPEEYNHFTSSLLLLKDLDKAQVHAALRVEEENELHCTTSSHSAMAAKSRQPPPPSSQSSSSSSCIFCSGSHPTEKCFALDRARKTYLGGEAGQ